MIIILPDLELIGVESLDFSSSIKLCWFVSKHCFVVFEEEGRGSSSICTTIELSQLGQQFFLFSSGKLSSIL